MTEQPRAKGSVAPRSSASLRAPQDGLTRDWDKSSEMDGLQTPGLRSRLRNGLQGLFNVTTLAGAFVAISAVYCFGIGRDRYQASSEFVIKQPLPPATASTMVLGTMQSSSVLSSLEDGRYLQVYLKSNAVKNAVFPDSAAFKSIYAPKAPDQWSGLQADANELEQLTFFRNQLDVTPQELSGTIVLTTNAFTADDAYKLNTDLLQQAQRFVNEVNQSISADQLAFAKEQVVFARARLTETSTALEAFQDRYGQLDPLGEQSATTGFITELESRLVDLKVEEASLRRQYRDPNAPEVAFVADQVGELERQIQEERQKAVGAGGRDLNKLATQASRLQGDVDFARQSLSSAMRAADNSRMESQRQMKFIVMLSKPQLPTGPESSWRWKAFLSCLGVLIVVWGVGGFMLTALRRD
ncbi:MAG TPA: sugar ABC transporter [Verrucomicrobiales bacterium]|nr:sugar ABC transporter [Verrucomicrobiales bacterium]